MSDLAWAGEWNVRSGSPRWRGVGIAALGEKRAARVVRYGLEISSSGGVFNVLGSLMYQFPSAKAMRSDSMIACRYGALLWSFWEKVAILPCSSRICNIPRAIRATKP